MRVLVTGGTGFVGSHTAAALIHAGHAVRLLVRNPKRVRPALEPLGVEGVETVVGDVTDSEVVQEALKGSEAAIHCASVYSMDPRSGTAIGRTNVLGTETVLGAAQRLGLDPIVHVSSFVALIGTGGAILTPDSPPTTPPGAYFRSKADSDRVARKYQHTGAPVVITYPGSVWGPNDPHFGESCQIVQNALRGFWAVSLVGGIPITDVRDLARLHAALLERGRGPRRYMATARNVTIREVIESVSRATGRRLPTVPLPAWALLGPMRVMDGVQHLLPFRLPHNFQAVYVAGLHPAMDDGATQREFGIEPRDLDETVSDTIAWMVQSGRLSRRLAGRLGS